jgi:DNA-binding response OmpR family regulator
MTDDRRANVSQPSQKTVMDQSGAECAVSAVVLGCTEMVPGLGTGVLTGAHTILLVEDEAFVREVTVRVLKSAGYSVLTARNAAEARSVYHQFSGEVDLLLSDVILPDENGRILAEELRRQTVELAVLLVTGYIEELKLAQREGARLECLPKPFSASMLLEKIEILLSRKRWYAGKLLLRRACGTE